MTLTYDVSDSYMQMKQHFNNQIINDSTCDCGRLVCISVQFLYTHSQFLSYSVFAVHRERMRKQFGDVTAGVSGRLYF